MDSTSSIPSTEHRIFHVAELLEAILHELPIKDLLLALRVCKTWKLAIENSIELQKDLFFLADGDAVPVVQTGTFTKFRANPLLEGLILALRSGHISTTDNGKVILPGTRSDGAESWQRMLITQPPPSGFTMKLYFGYQSRPRPAKAHLKFGGGSTEDTALNFKDEDGISMGGFVEELSRLSTGYLVSKYYKPHSVFRGCVIDEQRLAKKSVGICRWWHKSMGLRE